MTFNTTNRPVLQTMESEIELRARSLLYAFQYRYMKVAMKTTRRIESIPDENNWYRWLLTFKNERDTDEHCNHGGGYMAAADTLDEQKCQRSGRHGTHGTPVLMKQYTELSVRCTRSGVLIPIYRAMHSDKSPHAGLRQVLTTSTARTIASQIMYGIATSF